MGLMEIVTEADMRLAELTFNRGPTSNCFAISMLIEHSANILS